MIKGVGKDGLRIFPGAAGVFFGVIRVPGIRARIFFGIVGVLTEEVAVAMIELVTDTPSIFCFFARAGIVGEHGLLAS